MSAVEQKNELLAAAVDYAKRGWPVFPLRPRGKEPLGTLAPRGFYDATSDLKQIYEWWTAYPDANIGVPTGRRSGMWVLDCDCKNGAAGLQTWERIESDPEIRDTLQQRTGSGGRQVFFKYPDCIDVPCFGQQSTASVDLHGCDIKGDGGYVVVPPSIHPNTGQAYDWDGLQPFEEQPVLEAPITLLQKVALLIEASEHEPAAPIPTEIPQGQRDQTLASVAGSMRYRGCEFGEIFAALTAMNEKRCKPALPPDQVEKIARSISGYPLKTADQQATKAAASNPSPASTAEQKTAPQPEADQEYIAEPSGLCRVKRTKVGREEIHLTNFVARITGSISEDDGVEVRRFVEIEAELDHERRQFILPAQRFTTMDWHIEQLGPRAILYPNQKEWARTAIQTLSAKVDERRIFTHTGWRKLGDAWVYLHAGGAIGPTGAVEGVEIHLPKTLMRYVLELPRSPEELRESVSNSLNIMALAEPRIIYPVLAAIYRACLGQADFSVWIAGPTGVFKSELAALALQHYGRELTARNLPGNFTSTGNALEALAFQAKDALVVIDDFAPHGSQQELSRYHATAERILRAAGNNQGRGRLRADATLSHRSRREDCCC